MFQECAPEMDRVLVVLGLETYHTVSISFVFRDDSNSI